MNELYNSTGVKITHKCSYIIINLFYSPKSLGTRRKKKMKIVWKGRESAGCGMCVHPPEEVYLVHTVSGHFWRAEERGEREKQVTGDKGLLRKRERKVLLVTFYESKEESSSWFNSICVKCRSKPSQFD